jgi:hypothetical protein
MALVIAGGTAEHSIALPTPEELAPNTVVLVSEMSVRQGTITVAEFRHALLLAAAANGHRSAPKPGGNGYVKLKTSTVESLLEAAWIQGQAAEWGIVVTPRQVARRRHQIIKESFRSRSEYRRFLREARYTKHDVNERVELELLATRLQWRIVGRIRRNHSDEQRAYKEFVAEFNKRWRARTVCAPEYVIDRCSNSSRRPPDQGEARPGVTNGGRPRVTRLAFGA